MTFCVYAHLKADSNEVFYIGKGMPRRVNSKDDRNKYWHNTAKKHGFKSVILYDNLVEEDALDLEVDLIALHRVMGCNLVNMTDGGEGTSGRRFVMSEEHKRKIGLANKGRPCSAAQKEIASKTHKGKIESTETRLKKSLNHKGHPISEAAKQKMRAAMTGRPSPKRGIPLSNEQKQKISESVKRNWAQKKFDTTLSGSN